MNVDFLKRNPPPHRQNPDEPKEFKIEIDESVRAGRDLMLAMQVRDFLEKGLGCQGKPCGVLRISVANSEGKRSCPGCFGFSHQRCLPCQSAPVVPTIAFRARYAVSFHATPIPPAPGGG